ncbi:MAG: NAD(P)/FAD-dependent oxidoreductase [Alphaproteobacteria bacterium]
MPQAAMSRSARPRIVVVGAGFGGLAAVQGLRRAAAEITLIDRRNYHLFQPLLYQVATAALSPADIAWPIRAILRDQRNVSVELGRVTAVDRTARAVVVDGRRRVPYDILVLATGARHAYFGHPEWEAAAPGLKKIDDATLIRQRVLTAFERAETATDPAERARLLTFVVVGGGPTGVEMAGAIAELARKALAADFRSIDPGASRVLLVEAGQRLLATFPEALSQRAEDALRALGVDLCFGAPVEACDADGVVVAGTRIVARTVVWAAGVMASPAARWLGADCDRAGRVRVAPDLTVPGAPEIFVIGDTAAVAGADGRPVPGIAPAAKQMGRYVARTVAARLGGAAAAGPFRYRHAGSMATIGRKAAVADFGRVRLSGFPAWMLWALAHVYFLIGWRNRFVVSLNWAWNYVTFQRGARLITGETETEAAEAALEGTRPAA